MEITIKELKYGSETGNNITYSFNSETELMSWIDMMVDFTSQCKDKEDECGESLYKYTGEFEYNGNTYDIYLDC